MAFSIFFSITVILMITFMATKKKLHLLEIFFMWMTIIVIRHNFLTIAAINLRIFDFAETPANYWAMALLRIFLTPLLIIWYFDLTLSPKPFKKWAWLPAGICILVGEEFLADWLDVYKHIRWKFWWSFIEWFAIFVFVNYPWIWFRNLLRKELK